MRNRQSINKRDRRVKKIAIYKKIAIFLLFYKKIVVYLQEKEIEGGVYPPFSILIYQIKLAK